jgi:hypothetical protein
MKRMINLTQKNIVMLFDSVRIPAFPQTNFQKENDVNMSKRNCRISKINWKHTSVQKLP